MRYFSYKLKIADPLKAKVGMAARLSAAHRWSTFDVLPSKSLGEGAYYAPHKHFYSATQFHCKVPVEGSWVTLLERHGKATRVFFTALREHIQSLQIS